MFLTIRKFLSEVHVVTAEIQRIFNNLCIYILHLEISLRHTIEKFTRFFRFFSFSILFKTLLHVLSTDKTTSESLRFIRFFTKMYQLWDVVPVYVQIVYKIKLSLLSSFRLMSDNIVVSRINIVRTPHNYSNKIITINGPHRDNFYFCTIHVRSTPQILSLDKKKKTFLNTFL